MYRHFSLIKTTFKLLHTNDTYVAKRLKNVLSKCKLINPSPFIVISVSSPINMEAHVKLYTNKSTWRNNFKIGKNISLFSP